MTVIFCRGLSDWHRQKCKMKVHPAILMKTKKSRLQVPGVRISESGVICRALGVGYWKSRNEGPSGYVDENTDRQVSGVRYQVSGSACQGLSAEDWVIGEGKSAK